MESDTPTTEDGSETVTEAPAVESSTVETPAVESPVVETSVVETPAVESPAVESPVVESPVVESPVVVSVPPDTVEESLAKAFVRIEALENRLEEQSRKLTALQEWANAHTHMASGATSSQRV